jgi:uncharacterized membrane protein
MNLAAIQSLVTSLREDIHSVKNRLDEMNKELTDIEHEVESIAEALDDRSTGRTSHRSSGMDTS